MLRLPSLADLSPHPLRQCFLFLLHLGINDFITQRDESFLAAAKRVMKKTPRFIVASHKLADSLVRQPFVRKVGDILHFQSALRKDFRNINRF